MDVALAWRTERSLANVEPLLDSFVSLRRTRDGGEHVSGLLAGVNELAAGDAALRGLIGAVSVLLADVRFANPARDRLVSPRRCARDADG